MGFLYRGVPVLSDHWMEFTSILITSPQLTCIWIIQRQKIRIKVSNNNFMQFSSFIKYLSTLFDQWINSSRYVSVLTTNGICFFMIQSNLDHHCTYTAVHIMLKMIMYRLHTYNCTTYNCKCYNWQLGWQQLHTYKCTTCNCTTYNCTGCIITTVQLGTADQIQYEIPG